MTKQEAIRELMGLSSGTIATLTNIKSYEEIDALLEDMVRRLDHIDISGCNTWQQLWNRLYRNIYYIWIKNGLELVVYSKQKNVTNTFIDKVACKVAEYLKDKDWYNQFPVGQLTREFKDRFYTIKSRGGINRLTKFKISGNMFSYHGINFGGTGYLAELIIIELD